MKDSRKIAAILAADVVAYSRLMEADEPGTLGALKIRRAIFGQWWGRADKDRNTTDAAAVSVPSTGSPVHAATKSIAVLPFVNMSGEAGNEYFAEGLSEELINLLTKIPELRVAARTSAFKFKGEKINVQEVAQQLKVAHVLEGSVRKSGNQVRITAQLIKAADGYHLMVGDLRPHTRGHLRRAGRHCRRGGQGAAGHTARHRTRDTFPAIGPGGVHPFLAGALLCPSGRPGGLRARNRLHCSGG